MPLDDRHKESGKFDAQRNPIAGQLNSAMSSGSLSTTGSGSPATVTNVDEVLHHLWSQNWALVRAVALLEDQLTELRGAPADPARNLIHHSEEIDRSVVDPTATM